MAYQDSVRIDFKNPVVNDLKVLACDIHNTYLTAKFQGGIWTVTEPEFGSDQGKVVLVLRALYGLK